MATERKAEQELIKDGWLVYRVKGSTIWQKNQDIFGLFDILALHKGAIRLRGNFLKSVHILEKFEEGVMSHDVCYARYIQCKTNRRPSKKQRAELSDFKKKHLNDWDTVEWWNWRNRKGWEKIVL